MDIEPYPDEMFEEAARREAENKALEAVEEYTEEERQELIDDALYQLDTIASHWDDETALMYSYLVIQKALEELR